MMGSILTSPGVERVIRRRTRRDPKPRFKPDTASQLDAIRGCPAWQVPERHLARGVWRIVQQLDLSSLEGRYSSLGRHGFEPRRLLAIWVYGSLIGIHHGTKLSKAVETDAALRLLSGGHAVSRSKLNDFRQQHGALFAACLEQTVAMAQAQGLLALDDLAADSMRLRAHASTKSVRTLLRSKKRLAELVTVDLEALSEAEREAHRNKVEKHRAAVAACEARGRTSIVTTNPAAVLLEFPDGAGAPGHRVSAMAAGVQARFLVSVLVTADTHDYGLLEPLVVETRKVLARSGVSAETPLQIGADAGYCAHADLSFAARVRGHTDILIAGTEPNESRSEFFGRDRFSFADDGSVMGPAGRRMHGLYREPGGRTKWVGVGCASCERRPQCTKGRTRSLAVDEDLDRVRGAMRERMSAPGGR